VAVLRILHFATGHNASAIPVHAVSGRIRHARRRLNLGSHFFHLLNSFGINSRHRVWVDGLFDKRTEMKAKFEWLRAHGTSPQINATKMV